MLNFIFGAVVMLAVVTFAPPSIAAKPSEWLRKVVAWGRALAKQGPAE